MKVRKHIKPDKLIVSNSKLKKNESKKQKERKMKAVINFDKSASECRLKGRQTMPENEETASLIVNMDTSVDTSFPNLIENIGRYEGIIKSKEFNTLSDLVSPISFKKQNSKIGRLPCNYKQQKKKKLENVVSSKVTPVIRKCSVDGMEFHVLNESEVMLIMAYPMCLYFNGSLKIQVLMGSVEVLGYLINSSTGVQTVYSTRGTSNICLKTVNSIQSPRVEECSVSEKEIVTQYLDLRMKHADKKNIVLKLTKKSVILILHKNSDKLYSEVWPKFLFRYCSSYSVFPQNNFKNKENTYSFIENILNCFFDLSSSNITSKKFKEIKEWNKVEKEIILRKNNLPPKTIIIGGKSVGKSTFLRYMVNKSLNKWKKVLVLDFDIGQSEFMIPGCVSAVLVKNPLLGTNFTHLMDPLRSVFVGGVDAIQCLDTYMDGFQQVLNFCKQQPDLQEIPWFVNTMGFCKALGLSIATSVIQQVSPTHVVQIYSHNKSKNFDIKLMPQVVSQHKFGKYAATFADLNYTFLYIPSATEDKMDKNICSNEWGMPPKQARQLVLFSYLSKMLSPSSLNLHELTPYMVNISKLHLEVHQSKMSQKQALFLMNGNLVALCSKSENEKELPNCLGFGIVRGIDYDNNWLFLITPLAIAKLQAVNCLVKGNVFLPESFFLDSRVNVEGHVPYVSYTTKSLTNQHAKREYNPNKLNAGTHIKNY